jgi:hypothetical protein
VNIVPKGVLMAIVQAGLSHECFEHSELGLFDITSMRKAITAGTLPFNKIKVSLEQIVPWVHTNRVTEEARWRSLPIKSWYDDPGIFIVTQLGNGTLEHLMVDGHHRSLRRHFEGKETMDFYEVALRYAIRPDPHMSKLAEWGDQQLVDDKIVPMEK